MLKIIYTSTKYSIKTIIFIDQKLLYRIMKIYHNARCSKSRQGLALLQNSNKEFEIIEYLKTPLSEKELTDIIDKLQIEPLELVRKNEAIWKEKYKGKNLSNKQIINAMVENPKLIERPIVVNGDLAVIGRPLDKIVSII